MYFVYHPAALQIPLNFYDTVSIAICQQFEKNGKQRRTVLKVREKQAIDCSNKIFWYFYLMLHIFFKCKQPHNPSHT
jgi:hypothetical protein